ncbi:MAG: Crp/Fnr family transcriptional regulator, partial [Bacteroidota bacterium]
MEAFKTYLNHISPLTEETFEALLPYFNQITLKKNEFFVREGDYAKRIGFLEKGIVRAFFTNHEGKDYNKQFFVGPSIIGAYTSLLTRQPNKIAQQALTDCQVWVADYEKIEALYEHHHDLERLGRKIAEFYFLEKEQKELEMALLDGDKRYLIMRERFPT